MTIHKEGYKTLAISTILFGIINVISFYFFSSSVPVISWIIFIGSMGLLLFLISFFRIPKRQLTIQENAIIAPADGKVVVIEEVQADEVGAIGESRGKRGPLHKRHRPRTLADREC